MTKMKLAFAAVAFAISGFANATVITLSVSGTIDSGKDSLGYFGAVGRNLANLPYDLTITFGFDSPYINYAGPNGSAVGARESVVVVMTVDGVRYADLLDQHTNAQIGMQQPGSPGIHFGISGYDAAGNAFLSYGVIPQNMSPITLTDYLNVPLQGKADLTFQFAGYKTTGEMFKDSNPSTFILNGDAATLTPPAPPVPDPALPTGPTPVPEPTSAMLFGAGLLGFAALRRRQSRH
jgi:hypothetical protein